MSCDYPLLPRFLPHLPYPPALPLLPSSPATHQYGREFDVETSLRQLEGTAAVSLFTREPSASDEQPPHSATHSQGQGEGQVQGGVAPPLSDGDRKGKRPMEGSTAAAGGMRSSEVAPQTAAAGAEGGGRGEQQVDGGGAPSLALSLDVGAARAALLYHCGLLEEAYGLSTG